MMTKKTNTPKTASQRSKSSVGAGSAPYVTKLFRQLLIAVLLSIGALTMLTACSDDDDDKVTGGAGEAGATAATTDGGSNGGSSGTNGGSSGANGGSSGANGGSSGANGGSSGANGGSGNGGGSPLVGLYTGLVDLQISGLGSGLLNLPISINVQENGQATVTIGSGSDTVSVNLDTGALGTANLLAQVSGLLTDLLGLGVLECEPLGLQVVNADVDIGVVNGNVNVSALNCTLLGLPVNLNVSAGAFTAN